MYGINCITRVGRSPHSPHVLSWVSKVQSLPKSPRYSSTVFPNMSSLWLTTPPHSVLSCRRANGCHSEPSLNLPSVTSQDQEITHHSQCHLRQDRRSARCQIHTQVPQSGHCIQSSKKEWKQQKMGEYTENDLCGKHQCLNCSCSHLKHSHTFISMCSV